MEASAARLGNKRRGQRPFAVDPTVNSHSCLGHLSGLFHRFFDPTEILASELCPKNLLRGTSRAVSGSPRSPALQRLSDFRRERSPALPKGFFNWIMTFIKIPDSHVLNHHTLDGFLLLRYLKISTALCFFGCLITWPVLFPVTATDGGGQKELNLLSFSNISTKNRYYAHTFVAWVFFSKCSRFYPPVMVLTMCSLCSLHGRTRKYLLRQSSPGLSAFPNLRQSYVIEDRSVHLVIQGLSE